ncbi:hypothetical protein KBX37_16350 [Micromonospora sp. U56]|uniref:hypothetical protein n=1 Tax=Micromonospora sp. U56 TaxID=2824900 RepID=UPI001B398520|nr:hypothetical protein [Micromonospora sp. U56]MBQ0894650.1 hypothetical protein [Micromonospora sp. U56]
MSTQRPTLIAAVAGALAGAVTSQALRSAAASPSGLGIDGGEPAPEHKVRADDLDKELIDQLHAATLKASDSCFEIKKLCATVLVPTGTLVALFSGRRLTAAVFVSGLLVICFFWLADAVGYYYQRRLRAAMDVIWRRRAERCEEGWTPPKTSAVPPFKAAFNGSMTYYALLAAPVLLALFLYAFDVIDSPAAVSP